MKRSLAHFDFLRYKEFILSPDNIPEHLRTRAGHLLRDMEIALWQGHYKEDRRGSVAYLQYSDCLNVSDTLIFYTMDDSLDSLIELLNVPKQFNSLVFFQTCPPGALFISMKSTS